jgi:hypothetical protein
VRCAFVLIATALAWALAPSPSLATPISSGTTTIHGGFSFDFDSGISSSAFSLDADIFWEQKDSTRRQVTVLGGAELLNLGVVDFATITFSQLQGFAYRPANINGSDVGNLLLPGDVFAVQTTATNYAKVLVTGAFDDAANHGLTIQWITLNQDNQEFSPVPEATSTLTLLALSASGLLSIHWLSRQRVA